METEAPSGPGSPMLAELRPAAPDEAALDQVSLPAWTYRSARFFALEGRSVKKEVRRRSFTRRIRQLDPEARLEPEPPAAPA